MKHRVLCFVDDQQGRDIELLLPLIYHAEKYLECEIRFVFIWDIHEIYKEQPDLILLANTVGSKWHFEISKYAHEQNITVFALISEGNFRTNGTFDYWGYNTDKKFYQEYICHWSERTRRFLADIIPEMADRMVLTGATGFDRYKIYKFPERDAYLADKGLQKYSKVIGYAAWAFGKLHSETGREELKYFLKQKPDTWQEWTHSQMIEVENILRQLIENNPDILFLLKVHPNETHPHITRESPNEIYRLKEYPNVLYLKNEEDIHDLISAADLWMGFETTTAIDAWMLDKETVLINPDPDFQRDQVHRGSAIARTYPIAQGFIDEYYENGRIREFNSQEKILSRQAIIEESIGFTDGLNHLRAAHYLSKSLQTARQRVKKPKFRFRYYLESIKLHVGRRLYVRPLFLILPKFKKAVWAMDRCELKNINLLKDKYYPWLDEFYRNNNLSVPKN